MNNLNEFIDRLSEAYAQALKNAMDQPAKGNVRCNHCSQFAQTNAGEDIHESFARIDHSPSCLLLTLAGGIVHIVRSSEK